MPAVAPQGLRKPTGQLPGADLPAPGFVEQIGASFRTAKDDISYVQDDRLLDAYRPVMAALEEINGKSHWQYKDWLAELNPFANGGMQYDYDSVWSDIVAARTKNPSAFKDLPASRAEFEKGILTRQGQRAKDQELLARGDSLTANVLGGVGASVFDPVNMATAPIGGGSKTVAQALVREAIVNAGVELVQQVPLAQARERMGEELTIGEAALNVGVAAGFGAVLGGVTKVGADNWDAIKAAPKAVQEALWAKIAPALPESLRPKMDWDAIGADLLPDIAEAAIGRDNLSQAEADAIAVMRREGEIDQRNPFVVDGAGTTAHREKLAEAMQRIFDTAPASPVSVSRFPRETLRSSTAISTGVVPGDARSVMKSRIKVVESSGKLNARNPNSTALGPYQFLKGTWERLYKSRYGDTGKSSAEIHALRTDPRLNEILMDDLMALNEASLRSAGIPPTAGNLYLAHFAGDAGARKLHRAPANASARSVLGDAVVNANSFLENMTARDVIAWAERKMGGQGSGATANRPMDLDPEAAFQAELARRQAEVDAERQQLENPVERPPLIDDEEFLPDPIHDGEGIPVLATPIGEELIGPPQPLVPPRVPTAVADDIAPILPQLRAIVRDRSISLNEPAKLAEALGVDEALLRRGLTELALSREIRQNKKGYFTRLPTDSGPIDILTFIGRAGGLTEDGLAPGARDIVGGSQGHALGKGGRDYHLRLIPGSGPLVRKAGRSIEAMGELLHEAGYFGDPQGPRPTEAQVLEAIDLAATQGQKIYPFGQDRPDASLIESGYARSIFQSEEHEYYVRRLFDDVAEEQGWGSDDELFQNAARIYLTEDVESMDEAMLTMINREIADIELAAFYEAEGEFNARLESQFEKAWAENDQANDGLVDQFGADTGNAGARGANAPDAGGQISRNDQLEPPYLDPHSAKHFDDPDGPAAVAVVDSLEHDLRTIVDPAIAERQAQLAKLKAASPMQARVDQESTIGSPLFDAVDQFAFRIDEEGDAINPADLLAQIDEEAAMIKGIEDCL